VARRAVDVEPFLSALEHIHGHREGQLIVLFAIAVGALRDAGVEVRVFAELAARNGIDHLRPRAAMIGEEVRAALGDDLGLVVHVLAAAGDQQERGETEECCELLWYPRSQKRDLGHPISRLSSRKTTADPS